MNGWWISWYHDPADGEFELRTPWWVSGYEVGPSLEIKRDTIVAAVKAKDEAEAWAVVRAAYDETPTRIEERFCEPLGDTVPWDHPGGRFQLADWMEWD